MRRAFVIGAVTLLVLAGIGYLTFGDMTGHRDITVTAMFDEASGLYPGNGVEILGMPVGTVTAVTPRETQVEVTLEIDGGTQIPRDAMAATISTSILTDRRVELSPPYSGGPMLQAGDLIPLERTRTPVGFDRVLGMIDKLTYAMRGDGKGQGPLADLITIGATATAGNGNDIKSALGELSTALRMTSDGAATKQNLTAIITSLDSLTKAMADNDQTIRSFGSLIHGTSDIMAAENFGTGSTGRQINDLLQQSADLLERNRDTIKGIIGNTDVMVGTMNDRQRELAETFDVLPLMIDNFYNAIDPVNGSLRVHALIDKILFDSQFTKEVCNVMGLRQLGCSTGALQDYGPDFGLTYMLDSMARMGQGQ
jgi:phospholipid/cholesterol/gamma-HCH transport system substrate-binding protein